MFSLVGHIYLEFGKGLHWTFSVFIKVFCLFPFLSFFVASLSLFSQLSILFSYFLPLKILLLLSAERLPSYFPYWAVMFSRQSIVMGLCLSALVLYALHHFFESLINRLVNVGIEGLDNSINKVVLYENQSVVIKDFFNDFFRVVGSATFVFIALVVVGFLDYAVLSYILISFILCLLIPGVLVVLNGGFRKDPSKRFFEMANFLSASCFFFCFFCLVVQLSHVPAVNILIAAVLILFLRQLFSKSATILTMLISFANKRDKIDPVLFQEKKYNPKDNLLDKSFWDRFSHQNYISEISEFLKFTCGSDVKILSCEWSDGGLKDVISFKVKAKSNDSKIISYYIRVYSDKRMGLAKHEEILYESLGFSDLPLLKPVWRGGFKGFYHVVFDVSGYKELGLDFSRRAVRFIRKSLFFYRPSTDLVFRYTSSKPFAWQKIDDDFLARIKLIGGSERREVVDRFESLLPLLRNNLLNAPLAIVNPDITSNTILMKDENSYVCIYWGRWGIEPVGSGWPTSGNDFKVLEEIVSAEEILMAGTVEEVRFQAIMAAFAYEIYDYYVRQKYSSCISAMSNFIKYYESYFKSEDAIR